MGLQANSIRELNVPGISTTAFTATFIGLFSALATWSLTAYAARRLAATMVGVAAVPSSATGCLATRTRTHRRASGRNGRRHRDRPGWP